MEEKVHFNSLNEVTDSKWAELAKKRIYFGHQSVGKNIMDGVQDILNENPKIKLKIIELTKTTDLSEGTFMHSKIGKNKFPRSKTDAFADTMRNGFGNNVDIAFFKFCFVDGIEGNEDVQAIFKYYRETMSNLSRDYKKTQFVHVTMPLMVAQTGVKAWIKKILGRPLGGTINNQRLNAYNELLNIEYARKAPVFDLAKVESTFSNGKRSTFTIDNKSYFSLIPDYTYDGSHLNEIGRKKVAEQLLLFLANL
ncbi:MAG: hypothetical protein ABIK15_15560 [Pseudomonadota bacterium]